MTVHFVKTQPEEGRQLKAGHRGSSSGRTAGASLEQNRSKQAGARKHLGGGHLPQVHTQPPAEQHHTFRVAGQSTSPLGHRTSLNKGRTAAVSVSSRREGAHVEAGKARRPLWKQTRGRPPGTFAVPLPHSSSTHVTGPHAVALLAARTPAIVT